MQGAGLVAQARVGIRREGRSRRLTTSSLRERVRDRPRASASLLPYLPSRGVRVREQAHCVRRGDPFGRYTSGSTGAHHCGAVSWVRALRGIRLGSPIESVSAWSSFAAPCSWELDCSFSECSLLARQWLHWLWSVVSSRVSEKLTDPDRTPYYSFMDELHGILRLRLTLIGRKLPFRAWTFEAALLSAKAWPTWDDAAEHFTRGLQQTGGPRDSERVWRLDATWEPPGAGKYMSALWFIDRMAVGGDALHDAVASSVLDLSVVVSRSWGEYLERREITRLRSDEQNHPS